MPRQIASVVADGLGRPQPFDLATDWPIVVGAVGTVLALWGGYWVVSSVRTILRRRGERSGGPPP